MDDFKTINGNLTIIEGINFQVKIYSGNRFGHITIYEANRQYGDEFAFDSEKVDQLEAAQSPSDLDQVVIKLYGGKRGNKSL